MGLIKVEWDSVDKWTEEEISYFLYLEKKPIQAICRIRGLDKETVKQHVLYGKIKYGALTKVNNEKELFDMLVTKPKNDKIEIIGSLNEEMKKKLLALIMKDYASMSTKERESAIWILGELKDASCMSILAKASVSKFVNVRRMAVSAMGKLEDEKAEVALIRALDDENAQVVAYAVKALTKLKSVNAMEKIKGLHEHSDKEYIRRNAKEYLDMHEIGKGRCEDGLLYCEGRSE